MSPAAEAAKIALIVAAGRNGVIGRAGGLPWRMPSDLKTFRRLTMGCPIIMGRKTFQSIGKPLDGRDNIVITRDAGFAHPGVITAPGLEAAIALAHPLAKARGATEIMIIGGAEIYAQARPIADRIYLTRIDAAPDGDAVFAAPEPMLWHESGPQTIPPDPRDDHAATLFVYDRIEPN